MSEQRVWRIAVIPGDGIGPEVIPEGLRVLDALAGGPAAGPRFTYTHFPWGCAYYLQTGRMMPADGLDLLAGCDAIYLGAVGWPGVPDHVSLRGLLLPIRRGLDQYACLRPTRLLPGLQSPLRTVTADRLDFIVVRENTEGEYADAGGIVLGGGGAASRVAVQSNVFSEAGCERVMRFAFELACTRRRRKVTSATKSNAQAYGMVLWDEVFARVAAEYPDVETEQWLVDALAARFVLRPETLEVVVASNLFGDILSDLGSALAGGLGVAASANLDPTRRHPSMFEPVHGSAPDIAGRGCANPIAAIWSAALLVDHLGYPAHAARILAAVEAATAAGQVTPDLGGTLSTREAGDAVLAHLLSAPAAP